MLPQRGLVLIRTGQSGLRPLNLAHDIADRFLGGVQAHPAYCLGDDTEFLVIQQLPGHITGDLGPEVAQLAKSCRVESTRLDSRRSHLCQAVAHLSCCTRGKCHR